MCAYLVPVTLAIDSIPYYMYYNSLVWAGVMVRCFICTLIISTTDFHDSSWLATPL